MQFVTIQRKLSTFFLSLSFFALLPNPSHADGIPCSKVAEQATQLAIFNYRYANPDVASLKNQVDDSAFFTYYINQAALRWVTESNQSLSTRLLKSEESSALSAYKKLHDVIFLGSDCKALYKLAELQARALTRFERLFKQVELEMKGKAIDTTIEYFSNTKLNISSARNEEEIKLSIRSYLSTRFVTDSKTPEEQQLIIDSIYKNIASLRQQHKNSGTEGLLADILNTYAKAIDPHSNYFTPVGASIFRDSLSENIAGIGVSMSDTIPPAVKYITKGSPAERAGLSLEAEVTAISSDGKNFRDTRLINRDELSYHVRGPEGSKVYLRYKKKGETIENEVAIQREAFGQQEWNPLSHEVLHQKDSLGKEQKIGIIRFLSFHESIASEVEKAVQNLKAQNVDAIVIDVRSNEGGSFPQVLKMADSFIALGNIVRVKGSERSILPYPPPPTQVLPKNFPIENSNPAVSYTGPLIIAVDKGSASASEVLAGSLKDYKRALIVGSDSTYGKVTVQTMEYEKPPNPSTGFLGNGIHGALKFTVGIYCFPSGKCSKVTSDVVIPRKRMDLVSLEAEVGEAIHANAFKPTPILPMLNYAAAQPRLDPKWVPVSDQIKTELQKKSQLRLAQDPELEKINSFNSKTLEAKAKKFLSLADYASLFNWIESTFPEMSSNEKSEKPFTEASLKYEIEESFEEREILAISADFASLIQQHIAPQSVSIPKLK